MIAHATNTVIDNSYITEVYETHRELIEVTAFRFWRRYGGHLPTLQMDAQHAFLRGMGKGKPDNVAWEPWVRNWVWMELYDAMRTEMSWRTQTKRARSDHGLEHAATRPPRFTVAELLEGHTPDVQYVANLCINPPDDLAAAAERRGGKPHNFRACLRIYLRAAAWSAARIAAAFEEVSQALTY